MLADRPGVAAQQGAGESCEAVLEAVLERRADERSEQRRRFFDAGVRQRVRGAGDQRDEVVGRMAEAGVVERAPFLRYFDRAAVEQVAALPCPLRRRRDRAGDRDATLSHAPSLATRMPGQVNRPGE